MKDFIYFKLLAALLCAICMTSCEIIQKEFVPTCFINLNVEFEDGISFDANSFSTELACVKSTREGAWVNYTAQTDDAQQIRTIAYNNINLLDKNGGSLNGLNWEGETEIDGIIKQQDSIVLKFKLFVEASVTKEDKDIYCKPTIVKAEIVDGDFKCTLTSNEWNGKKSTNAKLKINKK